MLFQGTIESKTHLAKLFRIEHICATFFLSCAPDGGREGSLDFMKSNTRNVLRILRQRRLLKVTKLCYNNISVMRVDICSGERSGTCKNSFEIATQRISYLERTYLSSQCYLQVTYKTQRNN